MISVFFQRCYALLKWWLKILHHSDQEIGKIHDVIHHKNHWCFYVSQVTLNVGFSSINNLTSWIFPPIWIMKFWSVYLDTLKNRDCFRKFSLCWRWRTYTSQDKLRWRWTGIWQLLWPKMLDSNDVHVVGYPRARTLQSLGGLLVPHHFLGMLLEIWQTKSNPWRNLVELCSSKPWSLMINQP